MVHFSSSFNVFQTICFHILVYPFWEVPTTCWTRSHIPGLPKCKAKQIHRKSAKLLQSRVWRIYSNIRIYWSQIYIRTFVCINFSFTNIFGHSLVSVLECKTKTNIRIFVQFSIRILIRTFVRVKKISMNIFGYSLADIRWRVC